MPRWTKMEFILLAILIILFIVALGVWWHVFFGRPNPPLQQTTMTVSPSSSAPAAATSVAASAPGADQLAIGGAVFNVEIASTTLEQTRGLSYRTSLGANDGMLFIFPTGGMQTFWMKDMNFPLDMIWISGNTVVGFAQDAPAMPGVAFPTSTYSSPLGIATDKVLEVNAGTVAKYNIKVGDTVTIGPIE